MATLTLDDFGSAIKDSTPKFFENSMINNLPSFEWTSILDSAKSMLKGLVTENGAVLWAHHPLPLAVLSSVVTYVVVSFLLSSVGGYDKNPSFSSIKPYPSGRYDADAARRYYSKRLPMVVRRATEISGNSLGFGFCILMDVVRNEVEQNADERASELARLLTKLGPTFIKIGQTLSIRTDLLSPAYIRGLQSLQDRVPAFDTVIAKKILEQEWGVSSVDAVVDLCGVSDDDNGGSRGPVAAASLGQVYKARLKETGQEIAIKVQRPDVEEQIALDMYLLRGVGALVKKFAGINTDAVGTVDAWGAGFVDELDYRAEARNAAGFMDGIAATPLKDVVFAPRVLDGLSTRTVLTTEWVDGERLDRSSNEDVTVLCSIAMNAYLTMMLELGTLHCDPHPGNLLRTPEGRLCILDWGMVTRLDSDLQISLIEHMAHLTSGDYDEIPRDLLLLGFIPASKADAIEDSGVVGVLADIYGAFITGGRVAAPVNEVVVKLSELSSSKGNLFQIPPYFAYIAKSFSVLEGIGLGINAEYSIIAECLPYTSKRLLSDQNERTGGALSSFIFGPDKLDLKNRVVDYDRVEQLITGFGEYTTSAAGELLGKEQQTQTDTMERYADEVLDLIFAEEETPLQGILLEQLAKILTAESRSMWTQLKEASGTLPNGRSRLGAAVNPMGLFRSSPLFRMDPKDAHIVDTTRKLVTLVQNQLQVSQEGTAVYDSSISSAETLKLASVLGRKVWDKRSAVLKTGSRLAVQILNVSVAKLENTDRISVNQ